MRTEKKRVGKGGGFAGRSVLNLITRADTSHIPARTREILAIFLFLFEGNSSL